MSILSTIGIGFVAGVVGRFLIPGKTDPKGLIMTTIMGILGALAASYAGQAMGLYGEGEKAGLIGAIIGAIGVLLLYAAIKKK